MMRRIQVLSPFRATTDADRRRNIAYAEAAVESVLRGGDAPFAPHLIYPRVFDDSIPEERATSIAAGIVWMTVCDAVHVFQDLGISDGMRQEMESAIALGKPVVMVSLDGWRSHRDEVENGPGTILTSDTWKI